jgi:hypothetical protein
MCVGFLEVEVLPDPRSPKVQLQLAGLPVEVSVKTTVRGALPDWGTAVKFATGGGTGVDVVVVVVV